MRIGIDLGGTKIAGIVLDDAGHARLERRVPTPIGLGYTAVVQAISELARALEDEVGEGCTVGLGAPGQISRRTGRLKNSNAVCLNHQPLLDDVREALGREVRLANDANCFTLSEAADGAASGLRLVVGLILGTGVGGGIAINGRVHGGLNGIAGEWGHVCLEPEGEACYCGRRGCVETVLSGPGLWRRYRALGGERAQDAAEVARLAAAGANEGDDAAAAAIAHYLDAFGRGLAMVVNLVDPDAVVLGGGLSNMPALYTDGVAALRRHVFNDGLVTPVLQHRHGDASGVRGAAMLWPVGTGEGLGRPGHLSRETNTRTAAAPLGRLAQRRSS